MTLSYNKAFRHGVKKGARWPCEHEYGCFGYAIFDVSPFAYRRDKFGTIGKKESVKLSQVWNLNHRYRVGALRKHKYSILHEGRNNSVVALARGQYDEKELVSCFSFLQARHLLSSQK